MYYFGCFYKNIPFTMSLCQLEINNRIAYLNLNRPEKRNALSAELVTELKSTLKSLKTNNDVKVVVLSGNGEAFCAGADLAYLKQLQNNTFEENLADSEHLKELFELIYHFPKVVIAKINGHAIAGGCGLASVCDLVYSVPEAKFGYTEVRIGFIPAIVAVFLIRKVGESKAKDLLLTGRLIDAQTALDFSLINGLHSPETLDEAVDKVAATMVHKCSESSLSNTKKLINMVQDENIYDSLQKAAEMNAESRATEDCKKGISAFLNKEKVIW